jgi:hypothetical protein
MYGRTVSKEVSHGVAGEQPSTPAKGLEKGRK